MNPFCILKVRSKMLDCHPSDCIIKKTIASKTSLKKNTKHFYHKAKTMTSSSYKRLTKVIQLFHWTSHLISKKMEQLLADTSKFVKVEFNKKHKVNQELRHLLDLEGNTKTCLDNLLEKQYISRDYNFLKPCGSRPGIMYGLCKVHKGRGV